jgi:hypothetical protein
MLFDLWKALLVDRPRSLQPNQSIPLVGIAVKQLAVLIGVIPTRLALRERTRGKNSLSFEITEEDVP